MVLVLAFASGVFLALALTPRFQSWPRWASFLYIGGLAALFGPGLASVLYFGLVVMHAATPGAIYGVNGALLAVSVVAAIKLREPRVQSEERTQRFPWTWALAVAFAAGCVLLILDMQSATEANPNGEVDASAIWNLRGRYLAGGDETWKRAISPSLGGGMTGSSHPGYPLFLSSVVAMQWTASKSFDSSVPIAAGVVISLAVLALLVLSLIHI